MCFLPQREVSIFKEGSGIKTEDTLLVKYTWCEVNYMLCIWPIMLWGAEVSRRGAPGGQIQNWVYLVEGSDFWGNCSTKSTPSQTWGRPENSECRIALPTQDLNLGPSGCETIMLTTMPMCCPSITHKDRFWCSMKRICLILLGTRLIELATVANRNYVSDLLLLVVSVLWTPWLGYFSVFYLSVACV